MSNAIANLAPKAAPVLVTALAASGPVGWAVGGLVFVGGLIILSSVFESDVDIGASNNDEGRHFGLKVRKSGS